MNLKETKLTEDGKKIVFTCEATGEELKAAVQKVYKKEVKNISLPGFRKGKAPLAVIERMYGKDVFYEDAINDLLPGMYSQALTEETREVVGYPDVKINKADETGVEVEFTVELRPQLEVKNYKGVEACKHIVEVTDEMVENEINRLADRQSRMITVEDRAAEMGDTVDLAFDGSVDGVHFDGGQSDSYELELGSNTFIPGFEEQVAGHNTGDEFDVNVTFPEQYQEDLAGKAAVFACKINGIRRKEMPVIDDDFAKDVSEFDTLDELKADIRKHLTEENEQSANRAFENELLDTLADQVTEELSEAVIDEYVDMTVREFQNNMESQGLTMDMYLQYTGSTMEQLREQMKPSAEHSAKIALILEAVAREEGLTVSDEEYEAKIAEFAEQYKLEVEEIKKIVDEKSMKQDLLRSKAIDVIVANGVVCEHHHEEEE